MRSYKLDHHLLRLQEGMLAMQVELVGVGVLGVGMVIPYVLLSISRIKQGREGT
jgi:hypothetical protein